jgi:hypothetical protein
VTYGRAAGGDEFNLNSKRERIDDADVYMESPGGGGAIFSSKLGAGDNTIDGRGSGPLAPSGLSGVFETGRGADRIFGPAAQSGIFSGPGPDLVVSGNPYSDGDKLVSGPGPDQLKGGAGNNWIQPGSESDRVDAGAGDDKIFTSDNDVDRIDCGSGLDRVRAGVEDLLRNCETVVPID